MMRLSSLVEVNLASGPINQDPVAVTTHPFDTRRGEQVGVPPVQASK